MGDKSDLGRGDWEFRVDRAGSHSQDIRILQRLMPYVRSLA